MKLAGPKPDHRSQGASGRETRFGATRKQKERNRRATMGQWSDFGKARNQGSTLKPHGVIFKSLGHFWDRPVDISWRSQKGAAQEGTDEISKETHK